MLYSQAAPLAMGCASLSPARLRCTWDKEKESPKKKPHPTQHDYTKILVTVSWTLSFYYISLRHHKTTFRRNKVKPKHKEVDHLSGTLQMISIFVYIRNSPGHCITAFVASHLFWMVKTAQGNDWATSWAPIGHQQLWNWSIKSRKSISTPLRRKHSR